MKKFLIGALILILASLMALFFSRQPDENQQQQETIEGDITLYYISAEGTSFYRLPYTFSKQGKTLSMAEEVLDQLKKVPENESCQVSIPQTVVWSDVTLEDQNLLIDFTSSYSKLTNVKEIFLRASVVKSLVQLDGISTVEFKLNGTPLMSMDDQPIGAMTEDFFIDDVNANWGVTQDGVITLFFSNEEGDRLVGLETRIIVENNIPMEQEIIERLIGGGKEGTGCYGPLPEGTKVLKTVTKNGTCYVDFNENFLNPMENVSAEVTVYSVVNSLVELSNINKVQFTVNGQKVKRFRETMDLDGSFDRNLDILEASESSASSVDIQINESDSQDGEYYIEENAANAKD